MRLLTRRRAPAALTVDQATAAAVADVDVAEVMPAGPRVTGHALITATRLDDSPVELGIFDWVVDWADAMAAGQESYLGKWKADHPLVRFGEAFWMDMTRAVYDWHGQSLPSCRRAVGLLMDHEPRRSDERPGAGPPFTQELCWLMYGLQDWLDAVHDNYDHDRVSVSEHPDMREHLAGDVQRTCECVAEWAQTVGLTDLHFEAARAVEALKRGA